MRVRAKNGSGAVHATPARVLKIAAGEIASAWADGSPILRTEFENILQPSGVFEAVDPKPADAEQATEVAKES